MPASSQQLKLALSHTQKAARALDTVTTELGLARLALGDNCHEHQVILDVATVLKYHHGVLESIQEDMEADQLTLAEK